jgi:hypothetical protein
MPAVASKDIQREAAVEGSASRYRLCTPTKRDSSDEREAVALALVRDGCDSPTHAPRGEDSDRRRVGAVFTSVVVRVLRRVERQGGFHGV